MSDDPLSGLAATGDANYFHHIAAEDYRAAHSTVEFPLVGSVPDLIAKVDSKVADNGLLLPDSAALIDRLVVALLVGHVILAGPPGTGKTTLAGLVAEAFDCSYTTETATADWSTFDVIGGLQPAVGEYNTEILTPWLGHVPRAALKCADRISLHADDPTEYPLQGHWLILDEFNRAEIDKTIGPLYTVLGGGGGPERRRLPLWFGDAPERAECWIPDRFRIIGTLNTVDTAYVYAISQGLQRRFQVIYVGVPSKDQVPDELIGAISQAAAWWVNTYRQDLSDDGSAAEERARIEADAPVKDAASRLEDMVLFLRYDEAVAWPVGTAQIVDVIRQVVVRAAQGQGSGDSSDPLDLALSDCLIPQMSNLLRSQLDAIEGHLGADGSLPHSLRALEQVRRSQQTPFA